jgi:hypothetical protein
MFNRTTTTLKHPGETLSAEALIAQLEGLQKKLKALPEPQYILIHPDGTVTTGPDPLKLGAHASALKMGGLGLGMPYIPQPAMEPR